jgi:type IV pilus assembly protein PilE
MRSTDKWRGFTLIELLVAMAIVAILAAIGLPSYKSYVQRANRNAAQASMLEIANRQQQYLVANRAYADKTNLESAGYSLPTEVSNLYTYSITVGTSTLPTFTITFTPTGNQATDGALTLTQAGTKAPASKW